MKIIRLTPGNIFLTGLVLILALGLNLALACPATAGPVTTPRNIILIISDGMGYNHSLAAGFFASGQPHSQAYWQFPVRLGVKTHYHNGSYDPQRFWTLKDKRGQTITDSAAAATAMATGCKTVKGALGVDPLGQPLPNIVERAEAVGKNTGLVTSVPFCNATPAGFAAHVTKRSQYREIARQMLLDSGLDLVMGCGNPRYDNDGQILNRPSTYKHVGGYELWQQLLAGQAGGDADGDGIDDPWTLIQSQQQFKNLTTGTTPKRVLGIPMVGKTLQQERSGWGKAAPFSVPLNSNLPTLSEMSRGALNVVDNNPNGFFLMIEAGAVDWACHDNQKGRMIEEQIAADQAVDTVIDWVESNSSWQETLLIVTSDHETGFLTGPARRPLWTDVVNRGQGRLPKMKWRRHGHTNALVPLFAKGVAADQFKRYRHETSDPVRGNYIDNTAIGQLIHSVLRNSAL